MELCRHYTHCGGCKRQEISYRQQLQDKEARIGALFADFGGEVLPILGSEPYFHYRGKMELSFSQTKAGEKFLGLRMSGRGGRVFLIEECHICPPWMIEVAQSVYQWWQTTKIEAYFPPKDQGALRTLTMREGDAGERMVILTVSGNENFALSEEELLTFREVVLNTTELVSIVLITQVTKPKVPTYFVERILYGRDHFKAKLGQLLCKVRPQAFFQPNRFTTKLLYERIVTLGEFTKEDIVYDLYCGSGTIGLFVAPWVEKVWGIEINPASVQDAQENIAYHQCTNMEVVQMDAMQWAKEPITEHPTKIIVDPPRSGLGTKVTAHLAALRPSMIIYVSCNPETQVIDIAQLVLHGYHVQVVQPLDQFPHTHHIETIAILKTESH